MKPFITRLMLIGGMCLTSSWVSAEDAAVPDFQQEIVPLLKTRCVACHGPTRKEGKLNLALATGIKRGGEHGVVIVGGDLEKSLLWKRVTAGEMPPDQPLSNDEQKLLQRWILAGTPGLPAEVAPEPDGDEHWAFQSLGKIVIPSVTQDARAQTPIDHFLAAKLNSMGLSFAPEARRESLIRRVSFDLTGLAPTLAEIDRYVDDPSAEAYEQMVERYLSSPAYGERWGKYWLDAAGYADSNGYFNADTDRPLAYRYRDYVIRSVNADKPWDQFIREQLAGDELVGYRPGIDIKPEMVDALEAVHFLRNSQDGTDSSDGNPDEVRADKYTVLEGTQQIIGSALFGLTMQCARCHDHKFEPVTQRDYYRQQAVIYPAFNVENWVQPKNREISTATAAERAAWEAEVQAIEQEIAKRRQEFTEWARQHRQRGRELFADNFDSQQPLVESWSNTAPGDDQPAGMPAIQLDQQAAPAAENLNGTLHLIESGSAGDRALSTRKSFDWTPEEKGAWIQATFDLVAGGDTAPYVGYFIALRDFNDVQPLKGGNVLIDGAAAGQAAVHVDYPGADDQGRGKIGKSGYTPGRNFGVRITNVGAAKFELRQVVDGILEDGAVVLSADDLPDGGFGFEYCCGRSFVVDHVLIEAGGPSAQLSDAERELAKEHESRRKSLDAAVKAIEARRPKPIGRLALVSDLAPTPPVVRMLQRGEYKSPGEEVQAGAPQFLAEPVNPVDFVRSMPADAASTGQRLAFARWITQTDSRAAALLARVTVNRWWQHHFGTGIVATTDNLGYSGAPPTHPELIDFLAGELVRNQWSAKSLHRMILHSTAYRQASVSTADSVQRDPDARFLSRFPLRRLDGEAIRDAMLGLSGDLNPLMFGSYVPIQATPEAEIVVTENDSSGRRRSLYLQQRRTQVMGFLEVFDAPTIVFNCTARSSTTVPLQSLKLLNSEFVRARAAGFAKQVRSNGENDNETALINAFRTAWGRTPTVDELASARQFLVEQPAEYAGQPNAIDAAWIDFCQMLLASNAFLYVD